MNDKRAGFNSIDEYIATFPEDVQKQSANYENHKSRAPEAGDDNLIGLIQLP
jgi:hypothetical protein